MKIKIRHKHWLPKLIRVNGITVYPYILLRDEPKNVKKHTYKHELQHCYQVEEIGWFSFYISYLLYYLAGLLRYESNYYAYQKIPYEVEAYDIEETSINNKDNEILKREGIKV